MDEKAVSKALFKKISALRVTLSDEEQMMLDQMVTGDYEVRAHSAITEAARSGQTAAVAGRTIVYRIATDADEVVAHRYAMQSERIATMRVKYDSEKKGYLVE